MLWKNQRESDNVEYMPCRIFFHKKIIKAVLIISVIIILFCLFGNLYTAVKNLRQENKTRSLAQANDERLKQFLLVVFAGTEDFWTKKFAQHGLRYDKPKLVIYGAETTPKCENNEIIYTTFYCKIDNEIFISLPSYRRLIEKFGDDGNFAQIYLLAHEVGQHVQTLIRNDDTNPFLKTLTKTQFFMPDDLATFYAGMLFSRYSRQKGFFAEDEIKRGLTVAQTSLVNNLAPEKDGIIVADDFARKLKLFELGIRVGDN